jgi:RHS repeat-associated protein
VPGYVAAEANLEPVSVPPATPLAAFTVQVQYDALNRVTSHTTPDGSVTVLGYNAAGLLERLLVAVRGAPSRPVIHNIDYNARGERVLYEYADPTMAGATDTVTCQTAYTYDPFTFRIATQVTTRINGGSGDVTLQDLTYTHDPVGNIVEVDDEGIFSTTTPSSDALYAYDAVYRLTQATGREHPGQSGTQPGPVDALTSALPNPNDLQALVGYNETYGYDRVGNIERMSHIAGQGSIQWSRRYSYATTSNRLLATSRPGDAEGVFSDVAYAYTAHGALAQMPHLPRIDTDYADRMQHVNRGVGDDVFFSYDFGGQRLRKVWLHGNNIDERVYVGGWETFRHRTGNTLTGPIALERETLHVMDDQRRVAMVETKTVDSIDGPGPSRWRFQLDNNLGSSLLELDAGGNVITYEAYHPYGTTAFHATDNSVSAKRYRYTGKEKDEETGFYYHGARYYAPWLGRWTAVDPLTTEQPTNAEPNGYWYAGGKPTVAVDRDGKQWASAAYPPGAFDAVKPDPLIELARLHGQTEGHLQTLATEITELGRSYHGHFPSRPTSLEHYFVAAGDVTPIKQRAEQIDKYIEAGVAEESGDAWKSTIFEQAIEGGLITNRAEQDKFLQIAEEERREAIYAWAAGRFVQRLLAVVSLSSGGAGGAIFARAPQSAPAALSALNAGTQATGITGRYLNVIESMSARAIQFQELVSRGVKAGTSFLRSGVKFDFLDTARRVLVDAKGPGYANFVDKTGSFYSWFKGSSALVDQARRQLAAANGVAVEWVFAEAKALQATQTLLKNAGITGITLKLY